MPQWYDEKGDPSPFPTEAPPDTSIGKFSGRKEELLHMLESCGSTESKESSFSRTDATSFTMSSSMLMEGLLSANISSSILGHQMAANTVHSRELAALQLKYATKKDELDAAHLAHVSLESDSAMMIASRAMEECESADSVTMLRAQYNVLVQKVVASRALHSRRVSEVIEAQEFESIGIRRERNAFEKSLYQIEATYDASVRTLETQLLLLLRSTLEVRYKTQLETQRRRVEDLKVRKNSQVDALSKLQAEYAGLLKQLEEAQTQHAAHVAAAAREALATQRCEMEKALRYMTAEHAAAKQLLLDEVERLGRQASDATAQHVRTLPELVRAHEETAARLAREFEDVSASVRAQHSDSHEGELSAVRTANEGDQAEQRRKLQQTLTAADAATAQLAAHNQDLAQLVSRGPEKRQKLREQHAEETQRTAQERLQVVEAKRHKDASRVDAAVKAACAEERATGCAELERARCTQDPALTKLEVELERSRAEARAARARGKDAQVNRDDQLEVMRAAHGKLMTGMNCGEDEPDAKACAGVGDEDDLDTLRALAASRTKELVQADKKAAVDQLQSDCAAYADALAALQRALAAERAAHGAEVRRQQAELDAKESELALIKSEQVWVEETNNTTTMNDESSSFSSLENTRQFEGATTTTTVSSRSETAMSRSMLSSSVARVGAGILTSPTADGDDPVAAEWRKLVAAEKLKLADREYPASPTSPPRDHPVLTRLATLQAEIGQLEDTLQYATDADTPNLTLKLKALQNEVQMLSRLVLA